MSVVRVNRDQDDQNGKGKGGSAGNAGGNLKDLNITGAGA